MSLVLGLALRACRHHSAARRDHVATTDPSAPLDLIETSYDPRDFDPPALPRSLCPPAVGGGGDRDVG